jgi:hypothetical protein
VKKKATASKKRGPKKERLKIEGDWKDAVKRALRTKMPEGGWPTPEPRKSKKSV